MLIGIGCDPVFDIAVARKLSLELHYIDISGKKYLMDVFSNGTISLKKFGFKKLKTFFRTVKSKSATSRILQSIMDDGFYILNLSYLNKALGLRLENTYDADEVLRKYRFELHLLTIGNRKYLADLYSKGKINLKPYKFVKFPVQFKRIDKKKAIKIINKILESGIEISNIKKLKLKIGFLKLSSIEDLRNQINKFVEISKNIKKNNSKLYARLGKEIDIKKKLLRSSDNTKDIRDHNKLVSLRNDFNGMIEDFIEETNNIKQRFDSGNPIDIDIERERVSDLSNTLKLLKISIDNIKMVLEEV